MPNNHKVTVTPGKGFQVDKNDNEKTLDNLKKNGNPSNADLLTAIMVLNDKIDSLLGGNK